MGLRIESLRHHAPFSIAVCVLYIGRASGSTVCYNQGEDRQCAYSCCGEIPYQTCCTMSTSVLVVAVVIGAFTLTAIIAALVMCFYKRYRYKQNNRVRELRSAQHRREQGRVVDPPKPPAYVTAPPVYSEEMPESHFRPQTVTQQLSYNQRFQNPNRPTTRDATVRRMSMSETAPGVVAATHESGQHPVSGYRSRRTRQPRDTTGSDAGPDYIDHDSPPPYREFARGQTPAYRLLVSHRNRQNRQYGNVLDDDDELVSYSESQTRGSRVIERGTLETTRERTEDSCSRIVPTIVTIPTSVQTPEPAVTSPDPPHERLDVSRAGTRADSAFSEASEYESRVQSAVSTIDGPSRMSNNPSRMSNNPSRMSNNPSRMSNNPSRISTHPSNTFSPSLSRERNIGVVPRTEQEHRTRSTISDDVSSYANYNVASQYTRRHHGLRDMPELHAENSLTIV